MATTAYTAHDIAKALDTLADPGRHYLADYPAGMVAHLESEGLVETSGPAGVLWLTEEGRDYLDAHADLCPPYYVMTTAHHSTDHPLDRCQARTLLGAKREAYRALGDGFRGHVVMVGLYRHGWDNVAWLSSRVIGEPRWQQDAFGATDHATLD